MIAVATWVVALFVFSVPYENGVTIAGFGSLARLLGVVALGATVLSLHVGGRLRFRGASLFLIVAVIYTLWALLTYFWSIDPPHSLSIVATLVQLVAMAWVIHQLGSTEQRRDVLGQAYVFGAYATIVIAVTAFLASPQEAWRDVGNIDPNYFATGCALAIPIAWGLALRSRSRLLFWVNAIYPAFAVVAVVLAASRGGLFTTVTALAVIPLTMPRLSPLRRGFVLVALTVFTSAVFTVAPQMFPALERNLERLEAGAAELEGGTLTGRTNIWAAGFEAYRESPLIGHGAGTFARATEELLGRRRGAHNGFLSVAVSYGLVGLLLYLALVATVTAGSLAMRGRRLEHLVMVAALLVALIPVNMEHTKTIWFILAWLAATRPIMVTATAGDARDQPAAFGRDAPVAVAAPIEASRATEG